MRWCMVWAAAMLLGPEHVHYFSDFGYRHAGF